MERIKLVFSDGTTLSMVLSELEIERLYMINLPVKIFVEAYVFGKEASFYKTLTSFEKEGDT